MSVAIIKTRLKTKIIAAAQTIGLRQKIWALYSKYYQIDPLSFFTRFQSNDFYALYISDDQLVGFTGLRIKRIETKYEKCLTLYLGHTVIDENFRGQSLITKTCCQIVVQHFLTRPWEKVFVWCDALTYRAYLSFAHSLKKHYPSKKELTPHNVKAVLGQLGQHYYNTNYDPKTGTVRKAINIVDDLSAIIQDEDKSNPDIAFFIQKNPRYEEGHGLLMLAPANLENFIFASIQCLKKKFQN